MSIYLNAILMLVATIAAFVLLMKSFQALRSRGVGMLWPIEMFNQPVATPSRFALEQTCVVDAKRRLILVRCDEQRVLLLTGGPADILLRMPPAPQTTGAAI